MNLYPAQQSIVQHLQSDFTAAETAYLAKDLPDAEVNYDAGLKNPITYVVYVGSQTDPSATTNTIAQPRKARFNIEVHAKKLYGPSGMFAVRDVLEQSLIGFKPTNCQKLYLLKDDISKTEEGIWVHVYQLECQTMLVQKQENDPVIVPTFTELVNND
jgi:hypothetical protein